MKRLWFLISGYDDATGLKMACDSIRGLWPDPSRAPIVYSDGAYAKFPHSDPRSPEEVLEMAERYATFVVRWPVAAPTEFLKRTSYFTGAEGDYALILDTDEVVVSARADEIPESLTEDAYLVPLQGPKAKGPSGTAFRLFRMGGDVHHWGAHEAVFRGAQQHKRASAKRMDKLKILHHARWSRERIARKREYYNNGIREDESAFRRAIGA